MKRKMIKDLELETDEGLRIIIAAMDKLIDAQKKGIAPAVVYGKEEKIGEQESSYQVKYRALKILEGRRKI